MKGSGKWNDDRMVWDMCLQGQGNMGLHSALKKTSFGYEISTKGSVMN